MSVAHWWSRTRRHGGSALSHKTVMRLRWWHKRYRWMGHAGWVYTWQRPNWIGRLPNHNEELALRPELDTANYGPFQRIETAP